MARKKIPDAIQANVLTKSRRRCCICYGLDRNVDIVSGQIAHLDKESSNNTEDNLAFLCLDHHDQYDSRTSQSKNFTGSEVKRYRSELYESVEKYLPIRSVFPENEDKQDLAWPLGTYIRVSDGDSAQINILPDVDGVKNRYRVEGFALWGSWTGCPHTGELDFTADLKDGIIFHSEEYLKDTASIELQLEGNQLIVKEGGGICPFGGLNVTFNGEYRRAS